PPPGAITTAAPVSLSFAGRNTVSVGCVTFETRLTLPDSSVFSSPTLPLSPGADPGQTSTTSGPSAARVGPRKPSAAVKASANSPRPMVPFLVLAGCAFLLLMIGGTVCARQPPQSPSPAQFLTAGSLPGR